jgi:hypothetical protein
MSINATTMFDDLAWTLVSILKGNTASMATRTNATIAAASTAMPPRSVIVDPSASRVVFSSQWAPPRVLRRSASLAAVLRDAKLIDKRPVPGDPQTAAQRKASALPSDAVARLVPGERETIALHEDKRRGTYVADIPAPSISGSHAFELVLDWTDPRTGRVHREERVETFAVEKP